MGFVISPYFLLSKTNCERRNIGSNINWGEGGDRVLNPDNRKERTQQRGLSRLGRVLIRGRERERESTIAQSDLVSIITPNYFPCLLATKTA